MNEQPGSLDQVEAVVAADSVLYALLASYRAGARTERDKGTYFERLVVAFLSNDPLQAEQ